MKDHRLWKYTAIAFSISYLCWWSLAIFIKLGLFSFSHPLAVILHLIGGFGSTIAALFAFREKLTIRPLIRFVFACRKKALWFLLLFCVLEIAVFGLSSRELNPAMPVYLVPVVLLEAVFLYGGEEELGWRGTMQPILEEKMPFPAASLITGAVWAVWHIPLWFVDGSSQQNMSFLLFALLAILLSFWMAAIYKRTRCVFCCSVFHGLTNTLMSLFVIKVNAVLIIGFAVMLVLSIYVWYLPAAAEEG